MFGRERSLVRKCEGRPFALLGVNAEQSRETLRLVQHKENLPWPSLWDGPGGPVGSAWGVDRYPAFYLIDAQGQVRWQHFGAPGAELEHKVEQLLEETPHS
jgi:hypothetical protein